MTISKMRDRILTSVELTPLAHAVLVPASVETSVVARFIRLTPFCIVSAMNISCPEDENKTLPGKLNLALVPNPSAHPVTLVIPGLPAIVVTCAVEASSRLIFLFETSVEM